MCNWASGISRGDGKLLYFNRREREEIDKGRLKDATGRSIDDPDSHSMIAAYHGLSPDEVNKYEFRPIDRRFIEDQINTNNDANAIKRKMQRIDYKRIAPPELIFKLIVHPFRLPPRKPSPTDIRLLTQWISVGESVWDSVGKSVGESVRESVWDSVRESVRKSVWDSVRESVRESVWDSVWESVRDSVWESVRDSAGKSVWDSVGESVWDSVWAYVGSFFNLPRNAWIHTSKIKGEKYPYQSAVSLWERGLVASYDGKVWRLHTGPDGEIAYTKKV